MIDICVRMWFFQQRRKVVICLHGLTFTFINVNTTQPLCQYYMVYIKKTILLHRGIMNDSSVSALWLCLIRITVINSLSGQWQFPIFHNKRFWTSTCFVSRDLYLNTICQTEGRIFRRLRTDWLFAQTQHKSVCCIRYLTLILFLTLITDNTTQPLCLYIAPLKHEHQHQLNTVSCLT